MQTISLRVTVLFFGFISLMSCTAVINSTLKSKGVYDKEVKKKSIASENQEIIFFPVSHIGTEEFYDDLKSKIKFYSEESYIIFYEGVKASDKADSAELDMNVRKYRHITGKSIAHTAEHGGLFDLENNILNFRGKKIKLKEKLVEQPSTKTFDFISDNSENVDVEFNVLIDIFEKRYGKVNLNECDLNTPLNAEYECENNSKENYKIFSNEIILDYRNQVVVERILESAHPKIVVIYGSNHIKGMMELLKKEGFNY